MRSYEHVKICPVLIFACILFTTIGESARALERSTRVRTQARHVYSDNNSSQTSADAGRTYDGSASPGGSAGGINEAVGGAAQPKTLAGNSTVGTHEDPPVPVPPGKHIGTAWEKMVKMAAMLAMIAAGLALLASFMKKAGPFNHYAVMAIGMAIIGMGVYMAVLAGKILSGVEGEPGQKSQGIGVGIAALGIIALGIVVMMMAPSAEAKPPVGSVTAPVEGVTAPVEGAPAPAPAPASATANSPLPQPIQDALQNARNPIGPSSAIPPSF